MGLSEINFFFSHSSHRFPEYFFNSLLRTTDLDVIDQYKRREFST